MFWRKPDMDGVPGGTDPSAVADGQGGQLPDLPMLRMEEAAAPVIAEGITADTPIATPDGWRQAGLLRPGDMVLTFEHGPRQVVQTMRGALSAEMPAQFWPLLVPAWALDNRDDLLLLPEQKLLVESDLAEELYGDPFALIPARALGGWRGIACTRPSTGWDGNAQQAVSLWFDHPQIVYASRAVLLSCPGAPWEDDPSDWGRASRSADVALTLDQARHLVACLIAGEVGEALRDAGPLSRVQAALRSGWNRP